MKIALQSQVPYEEALIWQQHQAYYQQQGLGVFFKQEVPSNISSNPCYARQVAQLFVDSLPTPRPDKLQVLEIAAGAGGFAYNFLTALEHIAPDVAAHTVYWLSDSVESSVTALAQQPVFQGWLAAGRLRLLPLDASQPEQLTALQAEAVAEAGAEGFALVLANYFFSVLPTAVLHRQGDAWFQQLLTLHALPVGPDPSEAEQQAFATQLAEALRQDQLLASLPVEHPQYAWFAALHQAQLQVAHELERGQDWLLAVDLAQWLQASLSEAWAAALQLPATADLQALTETVRALVVDPLLRARPWSWEQLLQQPSFADLAFDNLPVDHQQALLQLTAELPLATLAYSKLSLQTLDGLLKLCAPAGLLLISDKAYPDSSWMRGLRPEPVVQHGGTLSHAVNFPLFASWLQQQGLGCLRTADPSFALQTLLVSTELTAAVKQTFQQHFVTAPAHEWSHALLEGGHALLQQQNSEAALRSFLKALQFRPSDATLQYLAALCYLEQQRYPEAQNLLEQPHDDIYGLLNRSVLLAECYRLGGQTELAIGAYQAALAYGEDSLTHYQLALCLQACEEWDLARQHLERAAELNPEDPEIQAAVEQLRRDRA